MAQYIDKDRVVAEIERRIKKYASIDVGDSRELDALYGAKCKALIEILSFLDTLELKEVDLKKEIKRWKNEHGVYGMDDLDFIFAKHFYELGVRAQKGE